MELRPISNPPDRWTGLSLEWDDTPPPPADLKIYEEKAGSVVSENKSPDIDFRFSLNPYRGCFHGCAYCYARPSHGYWDFGAGTDFERKIVVKVNAAERLREAFNRRSWTGERLVFSGNTDCYQPLEATYELTRSCLEVCVDYQNPVEIVTKGSLIVRDIDVLSELHARARIFVHVSVAFADDTMARRIEPWAPSPTARFRVIRQLADAGIPVGVSVSPIIPGLNDSQVADVLSRARDAGAERAWKIMLRMPSEVAPVFDERLREAYPDRAGKVLNGIRAARGGRLNESRFGRRMRGSGARWEAVDWLFRNTCRRLGFNTDRRNEEPTTFCRPGSQLSLFASPDQAETPAPDRSAASA